MRILIIGYGNPLRQDDGVGWAAAEALAAQAGHASGVELVVETAHQLLPELAEPISQADRVVFVDAAAGGAPGEIRQQDVEPEADLPGAFSHHVSPAGLLVMARALYGRCPPATLFTVTAARLGHGERLSPEVTAVLPRLLRQIRANTGIRVNDHT